jgi:hypothetical protein
MFDSPRSKNHKPGSRTANIFRKRQISDAHNADATGAVSPLKPSFMGLGFQFARTPTKEAKACGQKPDFDPLIKTLENEEQIWSCAVSLKQKEVC